MSSDRYPPVIAWAVVYPIGMRAYGGGQHALFMEQTTASLRASGASGAEVRKLVEEAVILRKFDGYVPADQASSMRYRIAELEARVLELEAIARKSTAWVPMPDPEPWALPHMAGRPNDAESEGGSV